VDYKVCVADDCVDETDVLCQGLQLHNYDPVPVYTGQECLDTCERGDIDLLLLDVGLPDIDGYEICRRLKDNPKTRDIAVIFVTARGAERDVSHGYRLGAVDYITKPFNLPMVMVRVDAAMRTREIEARDPGCPNCVEDTV